jgi:GTP-binding protein
MHECLSAMALTRCTPRALAQQSRILKIHTVKLEFSELHVDSCPESNVPEFAFIGRSNVGKSSLLNTLSNQRGLARVSGSPGRTRAISVFTVNKSWCFADLPGYGYAKGSKAVREGFSTTITDYLVGRSNLRCAFVLIDSRHPPQKIDLDFVRWIVDHDVPFALVFTKIDKLKPNAVKRNVALFLAAMSKWTGQVPRVFTTSATRATGRSELMGFIAESIAG